MTASRSILVIITILASTINIHAQDCEISYYSPDTILNKGLSVCIDVTIKNSSNCIKQATKISKFAYEKYIDKDFYAIPNSPFQVELYDSSGIQLEPLDARLYVDLKGLHDYYVFDSVLITSSFKIGILTSAYRLEPYKTYMVKLLTVLEKNKEPYIHSSYTFYITDLPYNNRFRLFKRKHSDPCFVKKIKSNR